MALSTERVRFPASGGQQLAARLELPAATPVAFALFAHCFTCTKDLKGAKWISRTLAERGIAVLRFDFTGLGESEGDFADTDFSSNLDDLVAAADWLRRHHAAPQLLVGHSLGGAAVLAAAARVPEARAVATLGAPSEPSHLTATLEKLAPELGTADAAEVTLAGRTFRIKRRLLDDLSDHELARSIAELKRALLVLHAPTDQIVGIEHAARIFSAAKHPKSFVSLDDADHLLLRERDARYAADVLAAWAGRYLDTGPAAEAAVPHDEVLVTGGPSGFANRVVAGAHVLAADEPATVPGGTDTGPSPYELLLAALGACTSMTLRMYADHKKLPLDAVAVRLRHGRIHARDCADCETREGRVDQIERELTLSGDLTPEQRARMVEIADRCPVHRTLTGEIKIRTRLGD